MPEMRTLRVFSNTHVKITKDNGKDFGVFMSSDGLFSDHNDKIFNTVRNVSS